MNSRLQILSKIQTNKPAQISLPSIPFFEANDGSELQFKKALSLMSGTVKELNDYKTIQSFIQNEYSHLTRIASRLPVSTVDINPNTNIQTLDGIELAVIEAQFGVAENGAIWIEEKDMLHRALPFITQHLAIILNRKNIVATMHEAYGKTEPTEYGVFIAGPSKTADIEQSLVIGAHGARTLTVLLI